MKKSELKEHETVYKLQYDEDLKRQLQDAIIEMKDVLLNTENKRLKLTVWYILNELDKAEASLFITYSLIANANNKQLAEIFDVNATTLKHIIKRIKTKIDNYVKDNI